jgi:peptidoglycan/xylan/chitin deacetylase (PgdA/CDA1 family)
MAKRKRELIATALRLAHGAGVHRVFGDSPAGLGVILMLHRVRPGSHDDCIYPPNRELSITPEFLSSLIERMRALGYDIVSMDEAAERLRRGAGRRFAVFTLDDAYRETLDHAYGIFRAAEAPFTVYVPTTWPAGEGVVRWAVLEALISSGMPVRSGMAGALSAILPTASERQKVVAYECLERFIDSLGATDQNLAVREIAARHAIDVVEICRRHVMGWDEIRALAADPLVTVGAHSTDHLILSRASRQELVRQLAGGKEVVERELGRPCLHLAYPYGGEDAAGEREFANAATAGYATAVTTRRGVVLDHHRVRMTALPRIAVSGSMQDLRCIEMLISGVPDRVLNGFRTKVA